MKTWGWIFLLGGWVLSASASDLSGSLGVWEGLQSARGLDSAAFSRVRLTGDWRKQWSPVWTARVGLSGVWTGSGAPYAAPSGDDGEADLLDATLQKVSDDKRSLGYLWVQKACVEFEKGRWQGSIGRVEMSWGEAHLVKPTCVFHARKALEAFGDPVLGSDGAEMSYAIWDNTNLVGAVRLMRGGQIEYVVRIENQGIGVSGTPLFAKREGEDGFGVEMSATLKQFQWRLEGVAWHEAGQNGRRLELSTGLYSAFHQFPVGAEFLKDGTGSLLGYGADTPYKAADYISAFVETPSLYRLRFSPTVAKSLQGGRWLAKPTLTWEACKHVMVGTGGRWILGSASGPFAGTSTQVWVSTTVSL